MIDEKPGYYFISKNTLSKVYKPKHNSSKRDYNTEMLSLRGTWNHASFCKNKAVDTHTQAQHTHMIEDVENYAED